MEVGRRQSQQRLRDPAHVPVVQRGLQRLADQDARDGGEAEAPLRRLLAT